VIISTRIGILRRVAAFSLALLVIVAGTGAAAPAPVEKSEYEIKADFLRACGRYVTWPSDAFAEADSPFVIGVVGKDPFGAALDRAVAGKTINNRRIALRRFRRPEEIGACHLLFIGQSEKAKLGAIFERLGRASTLTVGDTGGFAQRGGMINLLIENERLRWEINRASAERAGLKISSDLLRLAKTLWGGG
jgi:hypothetical protein